MHLHVITRIPDGQVQSVANFVAPNRNYGGFVLEIARMKTFLLAGRELTIRHGKIAFSSSKSIIF